ncbi:sulfotransferase family protein [Sphingomonas sp.]|uniref:sulfotransferase family protein n=1 Tax=Sphingomonas sp. TaxID=28214 RepID=UPI003B00C2C6
MQATPNSHDATGLARTAVAVLGMHRSGTSALTWLVGRMGAALPGDAMAATGENARGYFESVGVARAGERLLRAAKSSWFDPRPLELDRLPDATRAAHRADLGGAIAAAFGDAPVIALKDPRQCRFVPFLRETLAERGYAMRAALMLRGADAVAASLDARDGTTLACARLLWLRHMLDAERDTRGLPRAIVRYDRLLADWRAEASRLAPLLDRTEWAPPEGFGADVDAFLDRGLHHHEGGAGATDFAELDTLVRTAEAAFEALAEEDGEGARAALDRVADRLREAPWITDDVVHDELRHRRAPRSEVSPPPPPTVAPAAERARARESGDGNLAETARTIELSGLFDRDFYLATYPDVGESGLDPIVHYVTIGAAEGRNPSRLFDTAYYARQMLRRAGGTA